MKVSRVRRPAGCSIHTPAKKIPHPLDWAYGCFPADHEMRSRASEDRGGFAVLPGGDSCFIVMVAVADGYQQVGVPTNIRVVTAGRNPVDADHSLISNGIGFKEDYV